MDRDELVRKLIRGTIRRAVQESAAALLVVILFAYALQHAAIGSPPYYGCLFIVTSAGFIAGVVWSFALSYRLLRTHPATDSEFWREAFLAQARLLRLVPLWYLAPIGSGVLLVSAPTGPGMFAIFLVQLGVLAVVFGGVGWLNRSAAAKIWSSTSVMVRA